MTDIKIENMDHEFRMHKDLDVQETEEWLEALESVARVRGADRVRFLLNRLIQRSYQNGIRLPFTANTPYVNTIPVEKQPPYPGNRKIERRIKSLIRWNAMAMVVRANKKFPGIGGHISSYASSATLYEVGFNHFSGQRVIISTEIRFIFRDMFLPAFIPVLSLKVVYR